MAACKQNGRLFLGMRLFFFFVGLHIIDLPTKLHFSKQKLVWKGPPNDKIFLPMSRNDKETMLSNKNCSHQSFRLICLPRLKTPAQIKGQRKPRWSTPGNRLRDRSTRPADLRCEVRWFIPAILVGVHKSGHLICGGVIQVQPTKPFPLKEPFGYCSYKEITMTSLTRRWQLTRTQPWCAAKKVSITQQIFYGGENISWHLLLSGRFI